MIDLICEKVSLLYLIDLIDTDHHKEAHPKSCLLERPRHRQEGGAHHCVPDGKAESFDCNVNVYHDDDDDDGDDDDDDDDDDGDDDDDDDDDDGDAYMVTILLCLPSDACKPRNWIWKKEAGIACSGMF